MPNHDVLHVRGQMVLAPAMEPAQQHHIFKLGIADRTDDIQLRLCINSGNDISTHINLDHHPPSTFTLT
jgi:hypothetical protein